MDRPDKIKTQTIRIVTGCGKAYITVSTDPAYPAEIFGTIGKGGACPKAMMEAITKLVTLARLYGCPDHSIIKMLRGIRCPNDSEWLASCPDAVARALESLHEEKDAPGSLDLRIHRQSAAGSS